jgi:sodium/proline symporter
VGYFGIAYFGNHPDQVSALGGNNERIFIALTTLLFNPWIAGVILSAILAAVMSTLSCQLLVCSSAITEDFYKGFLRPNAAQQELVWIGRLMVLAVAVIAIIIAADPESKVLGLVSYAWAGFGAAFGPLIILSLFWKRMTLSGALAGMIIGALVVILWKNIPVFAATGVYEIIPGFICSFIAIILFSLISKTPTADMLERFDKADQIYKESV